MGKLSSGLLGGYSGKVGTTVGAIVKGQPTIRAYQKHVTNPKSARQVQVRNQFVTAKDFVQAHMPLCYRKQNMLGYGVVGGFQFAVGAIAKAIDWALQKNDPTLINLPWARKSISNGATFREDLFGNWTGSALGIYPIGVNTDPSPRYFGSDVQIEGMIVMVSLNDGIPYISSKANNPSSFGLVITPEPKNETGNPSVCGWHENIENCGDWNYIYRCDFSAGSEPNNNNTEDYNCAIGVAGAYPMESGNCFVNVIP